MATMVAVDLGAQSGRVAVGRFDGERLAVEEVHRFPNVPGADGGTLHWDILGLYRDVLDGLRAAGARGGPRRRGRRRLVGRRLRARRRGAAGCVGNPVHYRDARRAGALRRRARAGSGTRAVRAHRHPDAADQHDLRARRDGRRATTPALAGGRDAAADPRPAPLLARRRRESPSARTRRRPSASTRAAGDWAADLLERLDIPTRLLPEVVQPGTMLGPLAPGVAEETGLDGAPVVAVATHDTASAVAAVPFRGRRLGVHQRRHLVARRGRGRPSR